MYLFMDTHSIILHKRNYMKLHHIFYFFHLHFRKFYFSPLFSFYYSVHPWALAFPSRHCSPPILKVTGVGSLGGIFHIFLHGHVITYKHKYSLRECLGFGLKFFCTLLFLLSNSSRKPFSVHLRSSSSGWRQKPWIGPITSYAAILLLVSIHCVFSFLPSQTVLGHLVLPSGAFISRN